MALYEFERKKPVIGEKTYVHPEAVLIGSVKVGSGCFIGAGAVLRGDFGEILVGDGSNVQENAVLHAGPTTPTDVEADVIVAHGALLHDVKVRRGAVIGMGAILLHNSVIEEEAMVAAGAVVSAGFTVPTRTLVAGNPAEVKKKIEDRFHELLKLGLKAYQELSGRYLKGARRID